MTKQDSHGEAIYAGRTIPEARRQHLAENLLFWLKSYLKKSFVFGDTMSNDAIGWLKGLANSGRFQINWLNIKTGEKHEYNPAQDNRSLQPYRSLSGPTDWRIIVESS